MNKLLIIAIVSYMVVGIAGAIWYNQRLSIKKTVSSDAELNQTDYYGEGLPPILSSTREEKVQVIDEPILDKEKRTASVNYFIKKGDGELLSVDITPPDWFNEIPLNKNFIKKIDEAQQSILALAKNMYIQDPENFEQVALSANFERYAYKTYISVAVTLYHVISYNKKKYSYITGVYDTTKKRYLTLQELSQQISFPIEKFRDALTKEIGESNNFSSANVLFADFPIFFLRKVINESTELVVVVPEKKYNNEKTFLLVFQL
ncbi:MAG: hypothetical protein QM526_02300 [Alphaproteobacteria bacterium]|nr:hypothetical protein [Alphaproteobacteria bacterium]